MKIVVAFVVLASVAAASAQSQAYENIKQYKKCTTPECTSVSQPAKKKK